MGRRSWIILVVPKYSDKSPSKRVDGDLTMDGRRSCDKGNKRGKM